LLADIAPLQHFELLVEFLLELALPLEREVGRADDEHALDQLAQLQLADKEAGHDRLAGASVVGEQEAHPRELQEVVVHRLELVWQRIDPADREPEIRVELISDAEGIGLKAKAQDTAVAIERGGRVPDAQSGQVRMRERDAPELLALH